MDDRRPHGPHGPDGPDGPDGLDDWLHERIEPLPPPPGTFQLIKRRARRRKLRQAAASAGAVAAVVAAIIVIPRVTTALNVTNNNASSAANGNASGSGSSGVHSAMGSGRPVAPNSGRPTPAPGSARPPVPADFAATSVTFIGAHTGWVIGQAGVPGQPCATSYCTSVARTDDAGKTWYGVPAPLAGAPDGASGVSQIRFLNSSYGWAFGPGLYATDDGGLHWTAVRTGGYRVTDLETVGDRAFAVFASCTGSGTDFASNCTSFSLYSAVAGSSNWAPVPGSVSNLSSDGSASLVLTGSRGYLLGPGGTLYAGPVDGSAWQQVGPGPAGPTVAPDGSSCTTGPAQADGQPSRSMLAAATPSDLVLACANPPALGGGGRVFVSHDGGTTWQQSGTAPAGSEVTSAAAQPGGEIALATTAGLDVSHDGGATWQQVAQGAAGPGGFSYVGMTTQEQGVAVPANPGERAIWFTYDGGLTWQPVAIKG
jgi:photosystem II stability/assembly factor-like uncharacterized protein